MNVKTVLKWLGVAFQIALGVIFIWACVHKIEQPPDFAKMIYNYKITPGWLINLVAIYLPWIELIAGVALIVGVGARGANALVGVMLVAFIAGLGFNYFRGHPVECGCFSASAGDRTKEQLLGDMGVRLIEDIGMLLMVCYVCWIGPYVAPFLKRRGDATTTTAA